LHRQVEPLIGFFVNNLALRSQFDGNRPFREALKQQKQKILDAYAHQHVPFEMLVERLNPERSLSHDPIFQIVFSLNNNESERLSLPDLRVASIIQDKVLAKVDLEVVVEEREEMISVGWTYRTDLFAVSSIGELAARYARLLGGIVAEPGLGIFEYPLLDEEEERWLLRKGAGGERGYAPGQRIHEQFEEQARKRPEAVAVVYGEQRLSYGELNAKADRLARYLVEAGVGVESRVGIYLRRSAEMMIGALGVMKAGAAYVPLEPGLPRQRVEYMMKDAGVEWTLTETDLMGGMPVGGVDVVMMDGASTDPEWLLEVGNGPVRKTEARLGSENLAYILYTSGSTGRPKGVMVEHRGLSNYLAHAAETYLREGIEGSVVSSPLSFDATLTTILTPLVAGKSVEMLPEDESTLSHLAERMFGGEEGLLFKITPAHLEALEYVERPREVGKARHVIVVGGEQLGAERLRRWKKEMLPEAVFVNEYGPTEAVVGCSVWELKDESGVKELEGMSAAPIGRPIRNTQLYVMGEGGQLQPRNSVGELYIGGAGVARGYVGEEEMTRERFISDRFSEEEGRRLYRTGDLARWTEEGELVFVGRRDEQVKIRGYRIELGEIEQELARIEWVSGAAVTARETEQGQKRLVAYVTVEEEAKEGMSRGDLIGEMRDRLRKRLPEYMEPAHFLVLGEMPLTANGKVDRKALPAPEIGDMERSGYVEPRNETEEAMREVWQEVLKLERVGVQDNFFSLGGDSILSIRVVSMLKSRGIRLDIKDIFQHQTIEHLAAAASQGQLNQETFIDHKKIAQILIGERDEFDENVSEIII
jgi:amino acid adenylation domain-containing protein